MKQQSSDKPGRICLSCGQPVRRSETLCPRCGVATDLPLALRGGMMTPFGHGLCGLSSGIIWGAAMTWLAHRGTATPAIVWWGLAGGVGGAWLASATGRRLVVTARCSYEHLLLALLGGSLLLLAALGMGVQRLETLLPLIGTGVAGLFVLLRRYGYRSAGG